MDEQHNILSFLDSSEYEERADYLSDAELEEWTATSSHFNNIQRKLIQVGAKLIVGPRGTGKTHQMKCAYLACKTNDTYPLALYVTFNHYLRLETYLHNESNALDIFHCWVLAKISLACIKDCDVSFGDDELSVSKLEKFVVDIERNKYSNEYAYIISRLNIRETQELINNALDLKNRKRAVLLLDDAALTLTHDYMVEFFEIFRSIKSVKISPKASVYPGTTQYGPRFHVGQDAEKVSIWMNVQDSDYLSFMGAIINQRFNQRLNELDSDIKELLMFAAFGIPRTYITLIRSFVESDKKSTQAKFNEVIQEKCRNILTEYNSISEKIKQYKNIINIGEKFLNEIIAALKELNYKYIDENGDEYKKVITIGIEDIDERAERMIKFLVEAGLLYEQDMISHGSERKIRRFVPHLALLIKERIFVKNRGFNSKGLLNILVGPSEKHPLRRKFNRLLPESTINRIKLDLPPCNTCGTGRISDGQKFCHICGNPLVDSSIFKECMAKKLSELPFTDFQHKVINFSKYKTIEDVLVSDDTIAELKKVNRVGPAYAEKIVNKINAWTNEFLY
ncbi:MULTISPECIES: hypothetical protein [Shewanella]|uniref:hypothetical protein n=1 Tax=Shewanella TaxID=22 RepID=UPI001C5A7265|nr:MULTISPECIES: hypothetical protein [Shewanella]MBW3531325.1 hypothetical protein [Shewanella sp. NKUCC06_TVS]MCS6152120.1 zinc ribbon domain-containing protein [Shewanella baltica]MCU8075922.1 hypothetical protein [Shewanella sp. SM29]